MIITKLGHCCLVVEEGSTKLLVDPGAYSTGQAEVTSVDAVLISHEHQDHCHIESLRTVLQHNPTAKVYTNRGVGEVLKPAGVPYELLEHGQVTQVKGVSIEAVGDKHAPMLPYVPQVVNTGYYIGGKFFYPGDAFPGFTKPVKVLALPVVGPWLKLVEAIDYARALSPKVCFPVHDGMLKLFGPVHALPEKALQPFGITFQVPELGVPFEV